MPRILVVDDDPDFVEVLRLVLTQAGFEVAAAANGDQALAMALQERPDLIVLDVMMQGALDGVSAAHAIEEHRLLHQIPIIMVSSIASTPLAELFPTDDYLPIDAWLSKPVPPAQLLATVQRLLRQTRAA